MKMALSPFICSSTTDVVTVVWDERPQFQDSGLVFLLCESPGCGIIRRLLVEMGKAVINRFMTCENKGNVLWLLQNEPVILTDGVKPGCLAAWIHKQSNKSTQTRRHTFKAGFSYLMQPKASWGVLSVVLYFPVTDLVGWNLLCSARQMWSGHIMSYSYSVTVVTFFSIYIWIPTRDEQVI